MESLNGFFIICSTLMLGNFITYLTKAPIPGSIFGMVILLILLLSKVIKLETVDKPANYLISIMMLLFIPGGVNLMNVYNKFNGIIPQILIILIITTILTICVTAVTADYIIIKRKKRD